MSNSKKRPAFDSVDGAGPTKIRRTGPSTDSSSHDSSSTSLSLTDNALSIVELVEGFMIHLSRSDLTHAAQASKFFQNVAAGSPILRRIRFLESWQEVPLTCLLGPDDGAVSLIAGPASPSLATLNGDRPFILSFYELNPLIKIDRVAEDTDRFGATCGFDFDGQFAYDRHVFLPCWLHEDSQIRQMLVVRPLVSSLSVSWIHYLPWAYEEATAQNDSGVTIGDVIDAIKAKDKNITAPKGLACTLLCDSLAIVTADEIEAVKTAADTGKALSSD